jgi:hypothetical protein
VTVDSGVAVPCADVEAGVTVPDTVPVAVGGRSRGDSPTVGVGRGDSGRVAVGDGVAVGPASMTRRVGVEDGRGVGANSVVAVGAALAVLVAS